MRLIDIPAFFSRSPKAAREFFTPGRVFTMLWEVPAHVQGVMDVVDEEPSVERNRQIYTGLEGSYTGPYTGPTTVRRFIATRTDRRSCLCLWVIRSIKQERAQLLPRTISTFSGKGCSQQPDQENYGIIVLEGSDRDTLPFENGMRRPPLYIQKVAKKDSFATSKLADLDIAPPSALPTGPLPLHSRVDYRRFCEVELNVRCQNVGLVNASSLQTAVAGKELQTQDPATVSFDHDPMVLD